jgi:hypothetical protein
MMPDLDRIAASSEQARWSTFKVGLGERRAASFEKTQSLHGGNKNNVSHEFVDVILHDK